MTENVERDEVLGHLVAIVRGRLGQGTVRVAIDGIDAAGKTTLADEGQAHRALVFPALDAVEVVNDKQIQGRNWLTDVEQSGIGKSVRHPGPPFRLAETPWRMRGGAPSIGEHTVEILADLGLSDRERTALAGAGVIA